MKKVFISYARKDGELAAREIAEKLQALGYSVWLDKISIVGGETWATSIGDALENCDTVLALHSDHSVNKSYQCKGEWVHAFDLGKQIIPILLTPSLKVYHLFDHLQAVDCSSSLGLALPKILDALVRPNSPTEANHYKIIESDVPREFPDYFEQNQASYVTLINQAKEIWYLGSVGSQKALDKITLHNKLHSGSTLRVILIDYHNADFNYEYLSYWTALDNVKTAQSISRSSYGATLDTLRFLSEESGGQLEFRVLKYIAPVSLLMFDPEEETGIISVAHYTIGLSTHHKILRPATLLRRAIFPDLYEHFLNNFKNAWAKAEAVNLLDYIESYKQRA